MIKVLFIDDDKDTRTVVKLHLEALGFCVEVARDGAEGLRAAHAHKPDVILLDLLMPILDGFNFLRVYPGPVPVVVMSAYTDMMDLPREPYAKIVKPRSMREVKPILAEAAKSWRR